MPICAVARFSQDTVNPAQMHHSTANTFNTNLLYYSKKVSGEQQTKCDPNQKRLHRFGQTVCFLDFLLLSLWCQKEKPKRAIPDHVCKRLWPLKFIKPDKTSEPIEVIMPILATLFLSFAVKARFRSFVDRDKLLLTAVLIPSWSNWSFMATPLSIVFAGDIFQESIIF